jgi:dihydrofolate reductase
MARITVLNHLTLDGVMQAPAAPDEDRRGGFAYGGWAAANADEVMVRAMGERMAGGSGALLLGRRTYEDLASVWPNMPEDNPYTAVINAQRKYVVSSTLGEPLEWQNSTLLRGEVPGAVARLKEGGEDLMILGSGELIRALLPHGLIDELVLQIHPVVVGPGVRMFGEDDGAYAALRLVDSTVTTNGVVIATYRPAEPVAA